MVRGLFCISRHIHHKCAVLASASDKIATNSEAAHVGSFDGEDGAAIGNFDDLEAFAAAGLNAGGVEITGEDE